MLKWKELRSVLNLRDLTIGLSKVGVGHGIAWTI